MKLDDTYLVGVVTHVHSLSLLQVYLPPISNPEGIPLPVQDLKGQEWVFQFRFWPNNNSRMYVLEGVSPCIQSMQLRAGDTSKTVPSLKAIVGCLFLPFVFIFTFTQYFLDSSLSISYMCFDLS